MPPSTVTAGRSRAPRIARRATSLGTEGAFAVNDRVRTLAASGRDIINLSIGELDFPTPSHVVEAGIRALQDGDTRYTPPPGLALLREQIANTLRERGIAASSDQVIVTPGAKPALLYTVLALIEDGDEVLVPDPGFPIYPSIVRFAGGIPVSYPLRAEAQWTPDLEALARSITPRTRAIVINAPNNPTGGTFDVATLAAIALLAERHDLTIISDEIYGQLRFDDARFTPSIAALEAGRDRTVVIDGFSKAYAMTGWRLGFAHLPAALAPVVERIAINAHSCTPAFVQHAGIAALTGPDDSLRFMRQELRHRRDALVDDLRNIPGVTCSRPDGAFYAFPNFSAFLEREELTAAAFAEQLLVESGLAVLPGTAFGPGGEGHLRLSFALPRQQLAVAVRRLRLATRPCILD